MDISMESEKQREIAKMNLQLFLGIFNPLKHNWYTTMTEIENLAPKNKKHKLK